MEHTDELDFLRDRVMATRQVHLVRYDTHEAVPDPAVMLDHVNAGMSAIIVPSLADGIMHIEVHLFKGGNRTGYSLSTPQDGVIELTIRDDNHERVV